MDFPRLHTRPTFIDVGYAVTVAIFSVITYAVASPYLTDVMKVQLFVVAVGYSVPLVFRRVWADASAIAIMLMAVFRYLAFPTAIAPIDIAALFSIYAVVVHGRRSTAIVTITFTMVMNTLYWAPLLSDYRDNLISYAFSLSMIIAVASMGFSRRRQLTHEFEMKQRDIQRFHQHAANEQMAVVQERSRIARDMHDVVAHTLAVVVSQADGGRYAGRKDPDKAIAALDTIAELSRGALADIRSILGVLRESGDLDAPLTPQPVARDISQLIATLRDAGHTVSFNEINTPYPLPAGLGSAMYRITQEALTNSIKHGGPGVTITVQLDWRPGLVILSILDNGRGASVADDGNGNGLIGMAERATQFGGTLEAAPRTGGGFGVTARIPVKKTERTTP